MRIIRCLYEDTIYFGHIEDDLVILSKDLPRIEIHNHEKKVWFEREVAKVPFAKVFLEAPCIPTKAVCVGLNYRDHAEEFGLKIPSSPVLFIKPSTSLLSPGKPIHYPTLSRQVDYEAELVVVMGKSAKNVDAKHAFDYVLGYTCGNDVTARDLQPKDGQWTVAKSFDTFMPLGPWIETDLDPSSLKLRTYLNDEPKQFSSTSNLIFDVPSLIEYISQIMTLNPGDVIMTGTPSGVGPMQKGDHVCVEIEGIGRLENTVE